MLVLQRKKNQRIVIRDDIVIEVVDIRGGSVRLGIEAPADVTVDREEVATRIRTEGRRKGASHGEDR